MDWLLEKPLWIVAMGLVTAAVFGAVWIQTGRRAALNGLLGVLVLTGLLLALERMIETDREQIQLTLHRIAGHVERNDVQGALRYAHSESPEIRKHAEAELPRYDFQRVNIKPNLEVRVEQDKQPVLAIAEFNVVVVLSDRSGFLNNRRIPRFARVIFQQEDGDWRVVDYEHFDPREGFRRGAADR
jgi:hypothetical protein